MPKNRNPELSFFEALSAIEPDTDLAPVASPRLKSKIYSALMNRMADSGPLLDMETTGATYGLCVFEKLIEIAPIGEPLGSANPCHICHARFLAERFDKPPIYWKHCPYVGFQGR